MDGDTLQLRYGLLLACFFFLRISELLAISTAEISFIAESDGLVLSILARSSKTDQEKLGVTRTFRTNPSTLCPVRELFTFTEWGKSPTLLRRKSFLVQLSRTFGVCYDMGCFGKLRPYFGCQHPFVTGGRGHSSICCLNRLDRNTTMGELAHLYLP